MGPTSDNSEIERQKRREEVESGNEHRKDVIYTERGCCFWVPQFTSSRSPASGSSSGSWEKIRAKGTAAETTKEEGRWWKKGWDVLKKVRAWSEVVAGPRWKTFIRRFNKRMGVGRSKKFQYDPLSYALNFDDGHGQNGNSDEEIGYRSFSVRYASLPASAKTSMDLGKDGPDFAAMTANVRHG
ncbi:uncharacterized protein LOC131257344 [Magnolia sinica]|uniref:uncharacterized protein LOC131257344 n=1 Tax=Magnolia sinica TaxID=86752 RepID=UPI002659DA8C|nr:uncharacterized protein LOC131257344 [Magnolia sinica]